MKYFIAILMTFAGLSFVTPSYGMMEDRLREPRILWSEKADEKIAKEQNQETDNYIGEIRCTETAEDDSAHEDCDLEFVRNDGEVFDIENNADIATAACKNHSRHLRVKMEAEKTPQFLFWGGNLKIKKYEIEGDEAAEFCLAAQTDKQTVESSSSNSEFRMNRRGYL